MQASYLRVFWEWLARQLDFHFFVIAAGSEAKGGWTNGGSLVVPWKQWSICLVKNNTQLTFHRREQRTIMQCWPCPSFLLISQGSLLAAISCVMQITSGWHPAPSGWPWAFPVVVIVCVLSRRGVTEWALLFQISHLTPHRANWSPTEHCQKHHPPFSPPWNRVCVYSHLLLTSPRWDETSCGCSWVVIKQLRVKARNSALWNEVFLNLLKDLSFWKVEWRATHSDSHDGGRVVSPRTRKFLPTPSGDLVHVEKEDETGR